MPPCPVAQAMQHEKHVIEPENYILATQISQVPTKSEKVETEILIVSIVKERESVTGVLFYFNRICRLCESINKLMYFSIEAESMTYSVYTFETLSPPSKYKNKFYKFDDCHKNNSALWIVAKS